MSGRAPRVAVPAGAVDTAIHIYHADVRAQSDSTACTK